MKIRTRLTLLFTLITALILLLFASIIYFSARKDRENEFYELLKREAFTKAKVFLNGKVDEKTLQDIYHSNRQILNEVEVAIYNTNFELLYHDAVDIDMVKENRSMIQDIFKNKEIHFYLKDWQVVGTLYTYDNSTYILTAAAYDQYGYTKLNNLLRNCILVFFGAVLFIFFMGRFFAQKALSPVSDMIDRAKEISANQLHLRLKSKDSQDELSQLANTFNDMLVRLEDSFEAQKHFVSNISHELRTPLAAIITELELTGSKERNIMEYKSAIHHALQDAQRIVKLINSLLDMAKANYDASEIVFKPLRIDEVLLDARQQVLYANASYNIRLHVDENIEDENDMMVHGNAYLLKVAFVNLFENGCKFSANHQSELFVSKADRNLILRFEDRGIGIPAADIPYIFTPFYRGENKNFADGNGIGLSLTKRIIELHQGAISLESGAGLTAFLLRLPHL